MEAAADEEAVAAVAAEDAKQKRAAVRPLASFSPFRFPLSFSPLFHSLLFVHSLFFLPYAYKTMQLSFRATSSLLREQRCALSEERTEPTPFSSVSAGSPRGGFFSTFFCCCGFRSFACSSSSSSALQSAECSAVVAVATRGALFSSLGVQSTAARLADDWRAERLHPSHPPIALLPVAAISGSERCMAWHGTARVCLLVRAGWS